MKYGLEDKELECLCQVFAAYSSIESAVLYGSRAKGTHKPFSDVDITLVGKGISRHTLNEVVTSIDDLLLPYQFDVSIFDNLRNPDLIDHINRRGVTIYKQI